MDLGSSRSVYLSGENDRCWRKTDLWFRPCILELDLLGEPKRIIHFDTKVTHGGLDLCMTE